MTVQTKSSIPTSTSNIDQDTVVGGLLVLGILAMSIGLSRSDVASGARIIAATGENTARRNVAAINACAHRCRR